VKNNIGITDTIKGVLGSKVLIPYLGRTPENKPEAPTGLKVSGSTLTWEGDGSYYAIYKLDPGGKKVSLSGTTKDKSYILPGKGRFFVTSLSRANEESKLSEMAVCE
jgi:hypothetical protein